MRCTTGAGTGRDGRITTHCSMHDAWIERRVRFIVLARHAGERLQLARALCKQSRSDKQLRM